jgi:chromosomal replication initiation ATPase DnaA
VSDLFQSDNEYITGKRRQRDRVAARALLCYLSVIELGMTMVDLARRFDMTPAAVSCAVQRGEQWAKENKYQLEI